MNERLDWKQAIGRECNYLMIVLFKRVQEGDDQAPYQGGSNKNMKKWVEVKVLGNQKVIACVLGYADWN